MINSAIQASVVNGFIGATEPDRIIAAIDIGTNSIHMVVVRVHPAIPAFTIIAKEKDTVRLGIRDPKTGNLTDVAIKKAIAALQRCQELAKSFNAEQIVAVATSAVREAPNGRDFLQQVDAELGLFVNLISGQEEARRIYLGVLSGLEFNNTPHVIIDIGGGSTELILGDSHEPRFLSSTKVGAVRLTAQYITTDPINLSELQSLQAYIQGMLERPVEELLAQLKPGEQPRLVGTSGTIEALAMIQAREKLKIVPNPLAGYQLSRQDLQEIVERLALKSCVERAAIPGVSERRAEIIVAGALILLEAMKLLKIESLIIGERSLREGVVVDWMLTHGLIENRLRYQGSVRQRSVIKIAQKYQVNREYSDRVASLALSLFDQTQGYLHNNNADARELLWTAAILHDCGLFVSHAAYHKHSYYLIRNGEFLGFAEVEIEVIANIARYHRRNPPKKKHEGYNNLPSKQHRILVNQLSAILRLAVALNRRQLGAVQELRCEYCPDAHKLNLCLIPAFPGEDCALELWSLNYEQSVFEAEFGVKVAATLAEETARMS
jgi:exopolyphosphatase / guanosine-5'-triphosphate,3'-diphosphate pyrophosphatase